MLRRNYVREGRTMETRTIVDSTEELKTLKSILKTHCAEHMAHVFGTIADESVVHASIIGQKLSDTCVLDVMAINVEKPLLVSATANITVSMRLEEGGEEKVFAACIHMNAEQLKGFRLFLKGMIELSNTKTRERYKALPKKGGGYKKKVI